MEATPSTVVDLANAPDEDADFVEEVEVEDEEIEEEAEDSEQDEKPKSKKRKASTPTKSSRMRKADSISARLQGLEKQQIIDTIAVFIDQKHPDLRDEFISALPKPDMSGVDAQLQKLSGAIRRAFPNTRFGSSHDHFCYKRVNPCVSIFKKQVLELLSRFQAASDPLVMLQFLAVAGEYSAALPDWDLAADCKPKNALMKRLDQSIVKNWKAAVKSKLKVPDQLKKTLSGLSAHSTMQPPFFTEFAALVPPPKGAPTSGSFSSE